MKKYKKYANRRLYDVEKSTYVSLDEVKNAVLSLNEIQVVDAKTDEDITTSILLQVLNKLDMENSANKVITAKTLANLIRLYENPLSHLFRPYLESSVEWLERVNPQMIESFASSETGAPENPMLGVQQQYMKMWQDWQKMLIPTPPKKDE